MCKNHYHFCKECNDNEEDSKYKKLCIKNCTNTCTFCKNTTNNMCLQKSHKKNYVNNLNCGHNVCGECLQGCAKCTNTVISCPKCIVNYYFHRCKFCKFYLCNTCSRYCKNCEDDFCPFNKCLNCNKISGNNCSNCVNLNPANKNEIFTTENITAKRPGTGKVKANEYFKYLGKRAKKKYKLDDMI